MIKVVEQYLGIQGEGIFQGEMTYFIRVAGCNFSCTFCDSKYAQSEKGQKLDTKELMNKVYELEDAEMIQSICITGGEPTLYWKELSELIHKIGFDMLFTKRIMIETNGSQFKKRQKLPGDELVFWSVSPKLQFWNKKYQQSLSIFLEKIDNSEQDYEMKILVSIENDFTNFLEKFGDVQYLRTLIIQPIWFENIEYVSVCRNMSVLFKKYHSQLKERCEELRFVPQGHKFLWGNQRMR